ncbi:hypothetical protein J1605_001910 [Eschrichtius robustus]|uniref:Uncharacterized protein n=1 Tax=Eschrichtius robustus TaxID=9764 RepID=A0AB34I1D0_ESCRO|nr:hypothetical protein J1605_001910 [Eschrichtius robustus]
MPMDPQQLGAWGRGQPQKGIDGVPAGTRGAVGEHAVKPEDGSSFLSGTTVPDGRTLWPRSRGSIATPTPTGRETERPACDLLHKRPGAEAEDAGALPQVFKEETHLRHEAPLLAVHRSASEEAATRQTAREGLPAAVRLLGTEGRTGSAPGCRGGTGPGALQPGAREKPQTEVVPGVEHRKGRGDGRCHTQRCSGCSRRLAFSFRVSRGERPFECLRFPGLRGRGAAAALLVSPGPRGVPGLPPDSGFGWGPRVAGREGPAWVHNEPIHLGPHLPSRPKRCSSAGAASTWVGARCLPPSLQVPGLPGAALMGRRVEPTV